MVSSDDGPIFDNSLVTNVTAQLGGTAHLQCKVLNVKQDDHPVNIFSLSYVHQGFTMSDFKANPTKLCFSLFSDYRC
jgi:hypothetical protein